MELPGPLFCLTLAHNLDDRDVIERYLTEYPTETEQCIPIALRQTLATSNLPDVPFFSTDDLLKYLSLLWQDVPFDRKLAHAASHDLIYLVNYFLNQGADIHTNDDQPLRFAADAGSTDTVKLLLDRKADIHARHDDDALGSAATNGHTGTVKLLLDRKADIHASGDDALRYAAYYGHAETVELLLDRNADIHADDDYALINSALNGHTETVKLLLDRKADIHAENDEALVSAAYNNHTNIVKLLLEYNADPSGL